MRYTNASQASVLRVQRASVSSARVVSRDHQLIRNRSAFCSRQEVAVPRVSFSLVSFCLRSYSCIVRVFCVSPHARLLRHDIALQALPCSGLVSRVLTDTRGHRPEGGKKLLSRGGFRDRTQFAPRGRDGRCERSADAAAVRQTFDLTPMHTPRHYFQFMFLAILKSANFRGPPAGHSEAPLRYTGCPGRTPRPLPLGSSPIRVGNSRKFAAVLAQCLQGTTIGHPREDNKSEILLFPQ